MSKTQKTADFKDNISTQIDSNLKRSRNIMNDRELFRIKNVRIRWDLSHEPYDHVI